jgi:hypothetical protein
VHNYVVAATGELTPARTPHYGQKVPRPRALDVRHNLQSGMRRLIGSLVGRVPEPTLRRVADTPVAVAGYRWGMEQTLRGAKLEGIDAVIRMELTDGDQIASWDVIVRDGTATTTGPNGSEPDAVVRVDVVDWLALVAGKTSGGELLFGGRLLIDGDESKVVSLLGHLDREHQPF